MSWIADLERRLKELRRQKHKYHAKVLSFDGIYINWLRGFDLFDLTALYVWLILPKIDLTALGISIIFDIPLCETEPVSVEYETELPSPEEMAEGILVKIEPVDVCKLFDWTINIDLTVCENFEVCPIKGKLMKGIYDATPYNYSYYDPVAVREFIRSTMLKLWVERMTLDAVRADMEASARTLNILDAIKKFLFNKTSLMVSAHSESFILGYGILGYSKLSRRGSDYARIPFQDYDRRVVEAGVGALDHIQIGFILGVTPLGFGVLLPPRGAYKKPPTRLPTGHETLGSPAAIKLVEYKARRIINTFTQTAFAFANYSRPEEQASFLRSERAEQWMDLQALRYMIEQIVDGVLAGREANPVKVRMYRTAALQLVSLKAKRHRWGYKMFPAMTEEEFYAWWKRHWTSQGLNEVILDEIYARLKDYLPRLRWEKWLKGASLRLRRYRLARMRSYGGS